MIAIVKGTVIRVHSICSGKNDGGLPFSIDALTSHVGGHEERIGDRTFVFVACHSSQCVLREFTHSTLSTFRADLNAMIVTKCHRSSKAIVHLLIVVEKGAANECLFGESVQRADQTLEPKA